MNMDDEDFPAKSSVLEFSSIETEPKASVLKVSHLIFPFLNAITRQIFMIAGTDLFLIS